MSNDVPPPTEGEKTPKAAAEPSIVAPNPKKRSKKNTRNKPSTTTTTFTIRNPAWTYITLQHLLSESTSGPTPASTTTLDPITLKQHLTSALTQFLGLHGAAIPFDIMAIQGKESMIRVGRQDASAVIAAVGGWSGSRSGEGLVVRDWRCWGPRGFPSGAGEGLFD